MKSSSAVWPTCRTTLLVCLPNPENSAVTVYSPAGSAGIEYSPPSELCTLRVNPVDVLVMVTLALATLPPEVSRTRPERVALIAWACAEAANAECNGMKQARQTERHTAVDLILTLTPK